MLGAALALAAASTASLDWAAVWGIDIEHGGRGWTNMLFDSSNLTLMEESYKQEGALKRIARTCLVHIVEEALDVHASRHCELLQVAGLDDG